MKDIVKFIIISLKKIFNNKSEEYKLKNCLAQSNDTYSVLGVTPTCVALSLAENGLVVEPITTCVCRYVYIQ